MIFIFIYKTSNSDKIPDLGGTHEPFKIRLNAFPRLAKYAHLLFKNEVDFRILSF